jgi:hypothetical protein
MRTKWMPTSTLCWTSVRFLSATEDVAVFQRDASRARASVIVYNHVAQWEFRLQWGAWGGDEREEADRDMKKDEAWSGDRTRTSLMDVVRPQLQLGLHRDRRASIRREQVIYISTHGTAADMLWGTMKQAGRSMVLFPMRALDFSIDLISRSALYPREDSFFFFNSFISNQNYSDSIS